MAKDERQTLLVEKAKRELTAAMAELEIANAELREQNEYLQRRLDEEARRLAQGGPVQATMDRDASAKAISADEFDRRFDDGEDITGYLDLSRGRHINKTPAEG